MILVVVTSNILWLFEGSKYASIIVFTSLFFNAATLASCIIFLSFLTSFIRLFNALISFSYLFLLATLFAFFFLSLLTLSISLNFVICVVNFANSAKAAFSKFSNCVLSLRSYSLFPLIICVNPTKESALNENVEPANFDLYPTSCSSNDNKNNESTSKSQPCFIISRSGSMIILLSPSVE